MNRKEQKKRGYRSGDTGVEGKDQKEYRAAKIGKWESGLAFTFTQSSVWAFPFQ